MEGAVQFQFEFINQLFKKDEKNKVVSPLSVYCALALLSAALDHESLSQLEDLTHCSKEEMVTDFTNIKQQFASYRYSKILLANSMWVKDGFKIKSGFEKQLKTVYESEAFIRNLSSERTKKEINRWVSKQTKRLIPAFLSECLGEDIVVTLINSLYFQAKWKYPFDAETFDQQFYLQDGSACLTKFMNAKKRFVYIQDGKVEGVILPYKDEKTDMIILKNRFDENKLLSVLTKQQIEEWYKAEKREVSVTMPVFENEFEISLQDCLSSMGLVDIFDDEKADLSKMSDEPLVVSSILQKVKIVVDPKQTKAAAATSISISLMSCFEDETIYLTFDRPFSYLIVDRESQSILFAGNFDYPTSGE